MFFEPFCPVDTVLVVVAVAIAVVSLVVVTFFNHNFVNCKATLILEIKNLRNEMQYKPEWCTHVANNETDKRMNVSKIANVSTMDDNST